MIESIIANSSGHLLVWIKLSMVFFHGDSCVERIQWNDKKVLMKANTFIASELIYARPKVVETQIQEEPVSLESFSAS